MTDPITPPDPVTPEEFLLKALVANVWISNDTRDDGRRVRVIGIQRGKVAYRNEKTGRLGYAHLPNFLSMFTKDESSAGRETPAPPQATGSVAGKVIAQMLSEDCPPTIATDDEFRFIYCQAWRHALQEVPRRLDGHPIETAPRPDPPSEPEARFKESELNLLRDACHATYNGGWHENAEALRAFHHGMDTVFNELARYLVGQSSACAPAGEKK